MWGHRPIASAGQRRNSHRLVGAPVGISGDRRVLVGTMPAPTERAVPASAQRSSTTSRGRPPGRARSPRGGRPTAPVLEAPPEAVRNPRMPWHDTDDEGTDRPTAAERPPTRPVQRVRTMNDLPRLTFVHTLLSRYRHRRKGRRIKGRAVRPRDGDANRPYSS